MLWTVSGVESVVEPKPKKRRSSSTNVERTGLFQPPIKIKVPEVSTIVITQCVCACVRAYVYVCMSICACTGV